MRRARFTSAMLLVLLVGVTRATSDAAAPPRLVVLIAIDQLPFEYLRRFERGFSERGFFRRAARAGAVFSNAQHRHLITSTGPGHAALLTGAYPRQHGIVGNDWYDPAAGKNVNCVGDPEYPTIGTVGVDEGVSPRTLLVPTLGDELKLSTGGQSRVFGISFKDRAAVLPAGHQANGAFWMHLKSGHWVTSQYYANELPGYLRTINESSVFEAHAGKAWTPLHPRGRYRNQSPDDNPHEKPGNDLTSAFPHVIPAITHEKFGTRVASSPFGNDLIWMAAQEILVHEKLGKDDVPDLLTISFSSNDYVGHAFGPHSLEVEDITYRTDQLLGEVCDFLDQHVGAGAWVIALSSDHGVAPIPSLARALKLPAVADPLGTMKQLGEKLESLLRRTFPVAADQPNLVAMMDENQVYLRRDHPALAGEKFSVAQRILRDWLLEQPSVAIAMTRDALLAGGAMDRQEQMCRRAFHPRRSGDVLFAYQPYQLYTGGSTSHGSPWRYDSHVPVIFLGAGVRSGQFTRPVSPAAIAPTLAAILGVNPPAGCQEEPLLEAME